MAEIVQHLQSVMRGLGPAVVGIYLVRPMAGQGQVRSDGHGSGIWVNYNGFYGILTCEHVVRDLATIIWNEPWWHFAVSLQNELHWLKSGLVAHDKELDLALLGVDDIAPVSFNPWDKRGPPPTFPQLTFPTPVPTVGEIVYMMGYPRAARSGVGMTFDGFEPMREDLAMFAYPVDTVTETDCVFHPSKYRKLRFNRSPLATVKSSIGGMSGGPAFVLRGGHYLLCGVVVQCPYGGTALDVIHVKHLKFFKRDGSFDLGLIPPNYSRIDPEEWRKKVLDEQ